MSLQISAQNDSRLYLSLVRRIHVAQKHIQLEPTDIFWQEKRVSGDNPVLQDPLTYRRLAVLARSWSCQPRIAGRSVLNLQMWTFARMKRENEAERTVEIKPELIFGAAFLNSKENYETRHHWNLWMWWTESFCARSCGGLHKWVYDSQSRLKRRRMLHETELLIVCVCLQITLEWAWAQSLRESATVQGYPTVSTTPLRQL